MCYTGLFKRIIPFALTFAVGLFIASFFVSIAFPGERWRSGRRAHKWSELKQLRMDNEELREKNRSLRTQNEEMRKKDWDVEPFMEDAVPPVDVEAHHPPPRRPKQPQFGTGR